MNQKDCEFKARYKLLGSHFHVDLFIRVKGQETWQNTGHIVVGKDQILSLRKEMPNVTFFEQE